MTCKSCFDQEEAPAEREPEPGDYYSLLTMGGSPGQRNKSLHSVYANERTDERLSPAPGNEESRNNRCAAARVIPAFISRRIAN